jgi:hypothetical protein
MTITSNILLIFSFCLLKYSKRNQIKLTSIKPFQYFGHIIVCQADITYHSLLAKL